MFLAHKLGRLSVVIGKPQHMTEAGVVLESGETLACGAFIKCTGYHQRDLRDKYPDFRFRDGKRASLVLSMNDRVHSTGRTVHSTGRAAQIEHHR